MKWQAVPRDRKVNEHLARRIIRELAAPAGETAVT